MAKLSIEIESNPKLLREYARKSWKQNFSIPQCAQEEDNRFVLDNLLTPAESKILRDFTDKNAVDGEGYHGEKHPHTKEELFSSYNVTHRYQKSSPAYDLLIKTQFRVLRIMMNYFEDYNIQIFFSQLVKRTCLIESSRFKDQPWSHPPHLDVNPVDDVARTHTAVLYLNEECDGGNFIFQSTDHSPQRVIEPIEGRLIGFSASGIYHGITHIFSGTRYAYTFWFTTDKQDRAHDLTHTANQKS